MIKDETAVINDGKVVQMSRDDVFIDDDSEDDDVAEDEGSTTKLPCRLKLSYMIS